MSKVYFKNNGEIDIDAVTTFGVSVKDEGAIGMFGTGLKYAISVILRLGGKITIYSGEEKYNFTTVNKEIRGKDFNIIRMNGDNLGFTTETGKLWEPWMAMREILCNCKDEHGIHSVDEMYPEKGKTLVIVDCDAFSVEYQNRKNYVLENQAVVYETKGVQVIYGSSDTVYYKGVAVYTHDKPFKYTYNILSNITLTEDRTMKYSNYELNYTICSGILQSVNADFIYEITNCGDKYAEYSLDYNSSSITNEFLTEILKKKDVSDRMLPPKLRKFKPSLSSQLQTVSESKLTKVEEKQLTKAIDWLEFAGYNVSNYKLKIIDTLGDGVLGLADSKTNTIYISKNTFSLGTKYLAGTIYEEWVHLWYNVEDETRSFQDVVINNAMGLIELLKEDAF